MVTLDQIIRSYILSQGYTTLHFYVRYMKYLIDFLRKVSLTHSVFDKTIALKMDQKKAIQLPDDYIIYTKVGFQVGDRIVAFERDNTINLHHDINPDGLESPVANDIFNISKFPYTRLVFNNFISTSGELGCLNAFGIGHNGVGYFRPTSDREIQFSSDIDADTTIYLEYRTNGFSPTTRSTVPEVMAKLGEDYINWQDARRKFGDAAGETRAREIAYLKEYDEVMSHMYPITLSSFQGLRSRNYDVNKIVY